MKNMNLIHLERIIVGNMKIAAYQFAVSGCMSENFNKMKSAVIQAAEKDVRLLVFPECALTGYPPYDISKASDVDFEMVSLYQEEFKYLSSKYNMYIVVGTITRQDMKIYNSAVIFSPEKENSVYHKRALWGWDRDNFCVGKEKGIFVIDGIKIGLRICYEVRFPEYFRELYIENTDLNIILFYDQSEKDDFIRYSMIKSHILTRAVENTCHILTVDTIYPYQTAPTALFNKSGRVLQELERNIPGMLYYELDNFNYDFGEKGRKQISDYLLKNGSFS